MHHNVVSVIKIQCISLCTDSLVAAIQFEAQWPSYNVNVMSPAYITVHWFGATDLASDLKDKINEMHTEIKHNLAR